jgi:antitoxin ParD1/3/4
MRTVSLTPALDEFVDKKVGGGLYNSASEVVREGLRLLKEQDDLKQLRLEELKRELQKGIDSLDRGEGIPGEKVFQEIRQRAAKTGREQKPKARRRA